MRSASAVLRNSTTAMPHSTAAASTKSIGTDKPRRVGSQAMKTPTKPMNTASQRNSGTFSPSITTDSTVTMIGAA